MDSNLEYINIDDIIFKHWILFDYDLKDSIGYIQPHYLFEVKNSIHYNTLISGDFEIYNRLITTTNQLEHSENNFKNLIKDFNLDKLLNEKIIIQWTPSIGKYIIIDGCHRVSIL